MPLFLLTAIFTPLTQIFSLLRGAFYFLQRGKITVIAAINFRFSQIWVLVRRAKNLACHHNQKNDMLLLLIYTSHFSFDPGVWNLLFYGDEAVI